jgi:hypothetical protein
MKNLLEQMKSDKLAILKEAQSMYPHSVSSIIKELEANYFWTYLTYNNVVMLSSHLGLHSYDPLTISSIFEKEK